MARGNSHSTPAPFFAALDDRPQLHRCCLLIYWAGWGTRGAACPAISLRSGAGQVDDLQMARFGKAGLLIPIGKEQGGYLVAHPAETDPGRRPVVFVGVIQLLLLLANG